MSCESNHRTTGRNGAPGRAGGANVGKPERQERRSQWPTHRILHTTAPRPCPGPGLGSSEQLRDRRSAAEGGATRAARDRRPATRNARGPVCGGHEAVETAAPCPPTATVWSPRSPSRASSARRAEPDSGPTTTAHRAGAAGRGSSGTARPRGLEASLSRPEPRGRVDGNSSRAMVPADRSSRGTRHRAGSGGGDGMTASASQSHLDQLKNVTTPWSV